MDTVISVKTNKTIKKQAMDLAKEMGVPLSLVVTSLLKRFISEKELIINAPRKMSKALEKVIEKAEADLAKGDVSPVFDNADDFMAWLKAE
jgi:addiction module RelB/DinJ family antitoxin